MENNTSNLNLRDLIAVRTLENFSKELFSIYESYNEELKPYQLEKVAVFCYSVADAMLAARDGVKVGASSNNFGARHW